MPHPNSTALLLKNEPENRAKAYVADLKQKSFFIMGMNLGHKEARNNLDVSGYALHHHASSLHLVFSKCCEKFIDAFDEMQKTEPQGRPNRFQHSHDIKVHVWDAGNVATFANQLVNLNITPCLRGRVPIFVAIDLQRLEALSEQLRQQGCKVSAVDEMYDNPKITNEELYCEQHSYKNPFAEQNPLDISLQAYTNLGQMVLFGKKPTPPSSDADGLPKTPGKTFY